MAFLFILSLLFAFSCGRNIGESGGISGSGSTLDCSSGSRSALHKIQCKCKNGESGLTADETMLCKCFKGENLSRAEQLTCSRLKEKYMGASSGTSSNAGTGASRTNKDWEAVCKQDLAQLAATEALICKALQAKKAAETTDCKASGLTAAQQAYCRKKAAHEAARKKLQAQLQQTKAGSGKAKCRAVTLAGEVSARYELFGQLLQDLDGKFPEVEQTATYTSTITRGERTVTREFNRTYKVRCPDPLKTAPVTAADAAVVGSLLRMQAEYCAGDLVKVLQAYHNLAYGEAAKAGADEKSRRLKQSAQAKNRTKHMLGVFAVAMDSLEKAMEKLAGEQWLVRVSEVRLNTSAPQKVERASLCVPAARCTGAGLAVDSAAGLAKVSRCEWPHEMYTRKRLKACPATESEFFSKSVGNAASVEVKCHAVGGAVQFTGAGQDRTVAGERAACAANGQYKQLLAALGECNRGNLLQRFKFAAAGCVAEDGEGTATKTGTPVDQAATAQADCEQKGCLLGKRCSDPMKTVLAELNTCVCGKLGNDSALAGKVGVLGPVLRAVYGSRCPFRMKCKAKTDGSGFEGDLRLRKRVVLYRVRMKRGLKLKWFYKRLCGEDAGSDQGAKPLVDAKEVCARYLSIQKKVDEEIAKAEAEVAEKEDGPDRRRLADAQEAEAGELAIVVGDGDAEPNMEGNEHVQGKIAETSCEHSPGQQQSCLPPAELTAGGFETGEVTSGAASTRVGLSLLLAVVGLALGGW